MSQANKVVQLIDGYARKGGKYLASGSVTLVCSNDVFILVDCGDPWNGEEVLQRLKAVGLEKEDINIVVVTHGHMDHCGNLALFKDAKLYMASDIAVNGEYDTLEENPILLANDVELHRCPGHTDHDLIVVVKNTEIGCFVIAGDIFENENDADEWKAVSAYPQKQEKSREKILRLADWIIPGHGKLFENVLKNKFAANEHSLEPCKYMI
ncbi:unnamed protein product [Cylicocyclus nassatus]|uniref:Metallo-beta-lactamase domain-containing protein n=1 Tax=Cylicocyclus nassatus TaxID=53992 RepID=A0AA36HD04_CYLNA|nr:unnamed protein product [Cylicocyclus nassatus]